jgi:hypothetical protein
VAKVAMPAAGHDADEWVGLLAAELLARQALHHLRAARAIPHSTPERR